jgi:hypothetical protein
MRLDGILTLFKLIEGQLSTLSAVPLVFVDIPCTAFRRIRAEQGASEVVGEISVTVFVVCDEGYTGWETSHNLREWQG